MTDAIHLDVDRPLTSGPSTRATIACAGRRTHAVEQELEAAQQLLKLGQAVQLASRADPEDETVKAAVPLENLLAGSEKLGQPRSFRTSHPQGSGPGCSKGSA